MNEFKTGNSNNINILQYLVLYFFVLFTPKDFFLFRLFE